LSQSACAPRQRSNGFTLIEVIAALVIFSGGVLMVIQVSGSLSRRMAWAATASEIVVVAQARMDSLEAAPFDSLVAGFSSEFLTVQNTGYWLTTTTTSLTTVLMQVDVSMSPGYGTSGPSYSATSFVGGVW
jgi:prepilin-type N-terminal cleavage/methylation domain-containing protein